MDLLEQSRAVSAFGGKKIWCHGVTHVLDVLDSVPFFSGPHKLAAQSQKKYLLFLYVERSRERQRLITKVLKYVASCGDYHVFGGLAMEEGGQRLGVASVRWA